MRRLLFLLLFFSLSGCFTKPKTALVVLHGYKSNAFLQSVYFGFLFPNSKFKLVLPNGDVDPSGYRFWNAGSSCCDLAHSNVNHVERLSRLISHLKVDLGYEKVVLLGHSNGGFMALRLACEPDVKLDGVIELSGSLPNDFKCLKNDFKNFELLLAHGLNDQVIPFSGGSFKGLAPFRSFPETLKTYSDKLHCVPESETRLTLTRFNGHDDASFTQYRCENGNLLKSVVLNKSGHVPWLNSHFNTLIERFSSLGLKD